MKNIIIINLLLILIFSCTFAEDTPKTAEKTDSPEQTYTVTYKSDYGTVPAQISGLKKGDTLTIELLPELTTDGYTFAGWYNGEAKVEVGYSVISNLELTAKWGIAADYVVKVIEALLGEGPHDITVIGDITSDTITLINNALINNSNAKVNLDLSNTTGLTSIGSYAFYDCSNLEGVVLPDSVTSIGEGAFYDCSNLKSVTIPSDITSIGTYTFYNCSSLKSVTIPGGITSIGTYTFYNCSSLESVIIPDGVTSIGEWAFSESSSLENVVIPDGVTSIETYAFYDCSNLESVMLPDSVTSIGEGAFYDCNSLKSVTLGGCVTSISDYAFNDCRNLATVNYKGTQEQWKQISIGSYNEYLTGATINYNYTGD